MESYLGQVELLTKQINAIKEENKALKRKLLDKDNEVATLKASLKDIAPNEEESGSSRQKKQKTVQSTLNMLSKHCPDIVFCKPDEDELGSSWRLYDLEQLMNLSNTPRLIEGLKRAFGGTGIYCADGGKCHTIYAKIGKIYIFVYFEYSVARGVSGDVFFYDHKDEKAVRPEGFESTILESLPKAFKIIATSKQ